MKNTAVLLAIVLFGLVTSANAQSPLALQEKCAEGGQLNIESA